MTTYRIAEAAEILGVSDDTVRRWVDAGRLPARAEEGSPRVVDGADLADLASRLVDQPDVHVRAASVSARNRMEGIVTRVLKDDVMAQVDLVCGHFRIVSLMSREAVDELGLAPGVRAIASVKSTNVVVEKP